YCVLRPRTEDPVDLAAIIAGAGQAPLQFGHFRIGLIAVSIVISVAIVVVGVTVPRVVAVTPIVTAAIGSVRIIAVIIVVRVAPPTPERKTEVDKNEIAKMPVM